MIITHTKAVLFGRGLVRLPTNLLWDSTSVIQDSSEQFVRLFTHTLSTSRVHRTLPVTHMSEFVLPANSYKITWQRLSYNQSTLRLDHSILAVQCNPRIMQVFLDNLDIPHSSLV
jgi:ABC-type molybdenum transport system ATPase subunit/photorepair protein PhrA